MPRKRPPATVTIGTGGLKHSWGQVQEEFHPRLAGGKAAKVYEEMALNDAAVGAVLYVIEAFLRRVDWRVEPAKAKQIAEAGEPAAAQKKPDALEKLAPPNGKAPPFGAKPDENEEDEDSDGDEPGGLPSDEPETSPEALKEAEFLESCMHDMEQSWGDFISDALSFLVHGYSLHEIVYKIRRGRAGESPRFQSAHDDGRIGWRCIDMRAQSTIERWQFDGSTSTVLGAWQKNPVDLSEVFLPIEKCVLFRTRTAKGNPEGRSILRTAYRAWYMKKRLEEVEAIGIARDLTGIPVMEVPAGIMATTATGPQLAVRAAMERLVSRLHRDESEGFVLPSELDTEGKPTGYKLRLLSSPGQKQIPADPVIRRYESRILMAMAAEFLMLGTEKQGSFALGATKSENFIRSLEWYVWSIADALNRTAVAKLYEANNVPEEARAKIVPGDLDKPDLKDLGLFLSQIAAHGLIHPTPKVEARLREIADLPGEEAALASLFEEEKQLEADARAMEAETARANIAATSAAANAPPGKGGPEDSSKTNPTAARPGPRGAKPQAAKPAAKKPPKKR